MKAVLQALRHLLTVAAPAMMRGAALSTLVLFMGVSLLALSGWFITAAGLAGMAGLGMVFDVFRPSAAIRFLALGRAGARYGERLLTHDATLRALVTLRIGLLGQLSGGGARAMARLRGEAVLAAILRDVDALDGLVLRVLLPTIGALVTIALSIVALGLLVGWWAALPVLAILPLAFGALLWLTRATERPAERAETAMRALRSGTIALLRDRRSVIVTGRIGSGLDRLIGCDAQARNAAAQIDRRERNAGFVLSAATALAVALAMLAAGFLLQQQAADPARLAIAIFAVLALAECLFALRRGAADLGRMSHAAGRLQAAGGFALAPAEKAPACPSRRTRHWNGIGGRPALTLQAPWPALTLHCGQAAVLSGPSGAGKTTLLFAIAGLSEHEPEGIAIFGTAPQGWTEEALRSEVAMVPQRAALLSGSIADNLRFGADPQDMPEERLWWALRIVELDGLVRARGGLHTELGEAGSGLSGGETRRLALARTILRRPALLLLDEPTEGLSAEQGARILGAIRHALPETAILATMHRGATLPVFDRRITLSELPASRPAAARMQPAF